MRQQYLKENLWQGGVHLDGNMFREIVQPSFCCIKIPEPKRLWLPMATEDGAPCRVCVSAGDYVAPYDIVGVRDWGFSEDFHVVRTALPGYVSAIRRELTGYRTFTEYVEICMAEEKNIKRSRDAEKKWQPRTVGGITAASDWHWMREELRQSGIPGINAVLFEGEHGRGSDILVLNAVRDDPSILYGAWMMKERPGQILYGLLIFFRLLGAGRIMIVVSTVDEKAVHCLMAAAKRYFTEEMQRMMSVIYVPETYPGGRDELLAASLEPELAGCRWTMLHLDQVLGAYDMIYDRKPWVWRRLMVGGCTGANGCYELPVGMALGDIPLLRSMCGPISDCIMIDGGLMAGKTVNPETAVVHSGMQSVIVLPRVEENERQCTGCGRCVSVCPVGKRPYSGAAEDGHKPCIGCGSCSYICPSRRRLKEWMVRGGGRKDGENGKEGYIDLPEDGCGLPPAVVTGYSSPYIRLAKSPFTCILSPFKL